MAPNYKAFIDNNGFFYKGTAAKDPSHAERPVVTQEFMDAMPDDGTPMLIVDIEAKVASAKEQKKLEVVENGDTGAG